MTDNGYPTPKTDTTSVQIQVNRLNYPTFSGTGTYSANLREDDPVGKDVVRVQAFRNPQLVCIDILPNAIEFRISKLKTLNYY